jgi:hypothetical protein
MKWTFFIRHKMAASALLAIVIGVVLLNNLSEQRNSDDLNDAFSSLYEDRLMAESYLLAMYSNLHDVSELSETFRGNPTAVRSKLSPVIEEMNNTITLYRKTKLTLQEEKEFTAFTEKAAQVSACAASGNFDGCRTTADEALDKLAVLSDIQVTEGARLKDDSQRIFSSALTSSQFEIAILIIIGVIIQTLVFSSRSLNGRAQQNYRLN